MEMEYLIWERTTAGRVCKSEAGRDEELDLNLSWTQEDISEFTVCTVGLERSSLWRTAIEKEEYRTAEWI